MPVSDYLKCAIYEQLEPFGDKGDWLRVGVLASISANIHRDPKVRREAYVPEDFIPSVNRKVEMEQRQAKHIDLMMQAFAAANPGAIRVKPKKRLNA